MHLVGSPIGTKNNTIFGTDGVRGQVGEIITPLLALQLGFWSGQIFNKQGPVLIGQDSRESSGMITAALTAGLTATGHEVWNVGLCPTAAIQFLIKEEGASGGLMVSASHNPPEDNGIKLFGSDGSKISNKEKQLIESKLYGESNEIEKIRNNYYGKSFQRYELLQKYQRDLFLSIGEPKLNNLSIVLDLCWGSATACGKELFESLGAKVTALHAEPNGNLINVNCGSTELSPLRKAVLEKKADMGFAFDGDSDRMLAIDNKGRVIDGDHVLFLWGTFLKEKDQLPSNRLVGTVMSNLGFEKAWQDKGGTLERTAVGDQNVHAAMMKTGAGLGGEQSGHILSAAHGLVGDGLLTALQIASICNQKNQTLAEWRDQSFKPFPQKLINVPISNSMRNQNWREIEPLKIAVRNAESAMGQEGRVLLRASGTEPLLRVMVEAEDSRMVDSWTSHIADLAEQHFDAA